MVENFYQNHVFFCLNQRPDGEACCQDKGADADSGVHLAGAFKNAASRNIGAGRRRR